MDQCDSKIDLVKYMWVSDLYFMVHWFLPYIIVIDLNYFYTLRNGADRGYSCPSRHLLLYYYWFIVNCIWKIMWVFLLCLLTINRTKMVVVEKKWVQKKLFSPSKCCYNWKLLYWLFLLVLICRIHFSLWFKLDILFDTLNACVFHLIRGFEILKDNHFSIFYYWDIKGKEKNEYRSANFDLSCISSTQQNNSSMLSFKQWQTYLSMGSLKESELL